MVKYINLLMVNVAVFMSMHAGADAARGNDQPIALFGNGGIFTSVSNILLFIVGAIAVIMIILAGLRYITSAGNSSAVTAANNTILYAIIGLIVAILAYALINFVITSFADEDGLSSRSGSLDVLPGTGATQTTDLPVTGGL